jgi:hypothetical protein
VAAALLRDVEGVLALPGLPTLDRYPFTLVVGAMAAVARGAYERAEDLCAQALAAAVHSDDEVEGHTAVVRAHIARFAGDSSRTIEHHERALRYFRRVADPYQLVRVLNVLAAMRVGTDELATATDEARESVAIARRTGNPALTSCALAGLAYVLAYTEPERSRALIAEALELTSSLGTDGGDETAVLEMTVASAMLGETEQVLRLSSRLLDRGLTATYRLVSCLEPVAEALAAGSPTAAASIHGYVDMIAPQLRLGEPHRSFRERATATIESQLDADRITALRARGAAMNQDEAAAFAHDAITRALSDRGA